MFFDRTVFAVILLLSAACLFSSGCLPIQLGRTAQIEPYIQEFDLQSISNQDDTYYVMENLMGDYWRDFENSYSGLSPGNRAEFFSSTACIRGRLIINVVSSATDPDKFYVQGMGTYDVLLYDPLKHNGSSVSLSKSNFADYQYEIKECGVSTLLVKDRGAIVDTLRLRRLDKLMSSEFEVNSQAYSIKEDLGNSKFPEVTVRIKQSLTFFNEKTAPGEELHSGFPGYYYNPFSEEEGLFFKMVLEEVTNKHYRIKYRDSGDPTSPQKHQALYAIPGRENVHLGNVMFDYNAESLETIISLKRLKMLKRVKESTIGTEEL